MNKIEIHNKTFRKYILSHMDDDRDSIFMWDFHMIWKLIEYEIDDGVFIPNV